MKLDIHHDLPDIFARYSITEMLEALETETLTLCFAGPRECTGEHPEYESVT